MIEIIDNNQSVFQDFTGTDFVRAVENTPIIMTMRPPDDELVKVSAGMGSPSGRVGTESTSQRGGANLIENISAGLGSPLGRVGIDNFSLLPSGRTGTTTSSIVSNQYLDSLQNKPYLWLLIIPFFYFLYKKFKKK